MHFSVAREVAAEDLVDLLQTELFHKVHELNRILDPQLPDDKHPLLLAVDAQRQQGVFGDDAVKGGEEGTEEGLGRQLLRDGMEV